MFVPSLSLIRNLALAVLPKIAPFAIGSDALFPGDYFTIQCSIVHGDMPLSIYWTFNGQPVEIVPAGGSGEVMVSAMGTRSSVLTIESVRGQHAGNYTCFGTNAAGMSKHNVQLVVNGY